MEPLQVGAWRVDPAINELRRDDEAVRIEPKAMEVLVLLAARAGKVVSRDDLFATVWPGVVVGDEALTQSINKLRKALGDNPRTPSYIETISKRGYRLIAPVRDAEGIPSAGTAPSRTPRGSRRHAWTGAMAGALLLLLGGAVYLFRGMPAAPDAVDVDEDRPGAMLTVAVQPFEALGAGGGQAHLAHGISSDLGTELARLPGVRVVSLSIAPPDPKAPPPAQYLVSGSVQHEGTTLRINIQLVDTATRLQLWSDRIERPYGDLFAVQDEIVRKLADVLPGKLAEAAKQRAARRYTRSLEAYDHFLRGQALLLVRRAPDNEVARAEYNKAVALDPGFARAYAGLALTYAMDYRLRPEGDASPALRRAFELAATATSIDPDIPEAYWAQAFVLAQSRRHDEAIAALRKAIELDRSYADAYALMGGIYTYLGKAASSIPLLRTAMRLNPDGGYLYFLLLGRAYLFESDIEQANINLREAVARNPSDLETHLYLASAAIAKGDQTAAEWEAAEVRALDSGFSTRAWLASYPLTSAPYRDRLAQWLEKAGL